MNKFIFLQGGDLVDLSSFVAGEVKSMAYWDRPSGWRSVNTCMDL